MLNAVNQYLESRGIRITTGTIVDATIIHAPSSTKNRSGERDPEMHQTRKGKQWYFGLKAHIGVDSKQGHVHSVCTSAASVADKHMLPDLLHGEERKVWGDGGYQGQIEAIRQAAQQAQDKGSRRMQFKNLVDQLQKARTGVKARVESEGGTSIPDSEAHLRLRESEIPRYPENHHRLCASFALVNLYLHRRRLAVARASCSAGPRVNSGFQSGPKQYREIPGLCSSGIPPASKIDGCSEVPLAPAAGLAAMALHLSVYFP